MVNYKTWLFLLLSLSVLAKPAVATEDSLEKQRVIFEQAKKALATNQLNRYASLKQQLGDYPLQGYLDYLFLRHRLDQTTEQRIAEFLFENDNSFYADRLRANWLDRLARQKRWSLYLKYYREPQSNERQCLRLQALMATDNTLQAYAETPLLWLVPRSQDKACDPVFNSWRQAGLLTEDLLQQRIMLALQYSQFSLASYLAKSSADPTQTQAWITRWQTIHQTPLKLLKQLPASPPTGNQVTLASDVPMAREIIVHGIERLARSTPELAYTNWQRIMPAYHFSEEQKIQIRRTIGLKAALNRDNKALEYFGNTPNEPWRVRAALWQQDWQAVKSAIHDLNIDEQHSQRWQYWLGRSELELGEFEQANQRFSSLVNQRDFYSFLAADRLNLPYQMNHNPITYDAIELQNLSAHPGVLRLREFYALNMQLDARRQAYRLQQTLNERELQLLAVLTHQWGWHNQTIAILGRAQYWDALDLRFPVLFDSTIRNAGKSTGLDPSWLFGIARQESAFNPSARSHAGALGLMQVMPQTGKLIAKLINRPLKKTSELLNPSRNVELGSAYLKRMYDQNQRNPVLATASYNAGPHRVSRWLPNTTLPADIWIENIPFNETRKYTSNVLSYAAIFDFQREQPIVPLQKRMPAIQPKTP